MEPEFDLFESLTNNKYGTHLNYTCPIAHRFVNETDEPVDDNIEIFCEWESSDMNIAELPECKRKIITGDHHSDDLMIS